MKRLLFATISITISNLVSLAGIITLAIKENNLKKIIQFLVSLSTGAFLGGIFFHLLPETIEENGFGTNTSLYILSGIIIFFIIEKFIHWRHCHTPTSKDHPHPFAYMNLLGDFVHNFTDGLLIGGTFLTDINLGITTTIAVILHEIPQEIGDFGVLIHGGFSKRKALFVNLATSLSSFLGMLLAFLVGTKIPDFSHFLSCFTAGGFIYIAASDLIPQLHKKNRLFSSILQVLILTFGIGLMFLLKFIE